MVRLAILTQYRIAARTDRHSVVTCNACC